MFAHITRISDLSKEASKDASNNTIQRVVKSNDLDQLQALLKHLEGISAPDDNVDPLIQLLMLVAEQSMLTPNGITIDLIPTETLDATEIEIDTLSRMRDKINNVLHCKLTFNTGFSAFAKATLKLNAIVPKHDLTVEVVSVERGGTLQPGKGLLVQRGKDKPPLSRQSRLVGVPSSRQPSIVSKVPETSRETPHSRIPPSPNQLPTVPRVARQSGVVPAGTSTEAPVSVPIPSHGIKSIGPSVSPSTTRPAVPRPTPKIKKQANET
jgi:hypothetical protein